MCNTDYESFVHFVLGNDSHLITKFTSHIKLTEKPRNLLANYLQNKKFTLVEKRRRKNTILFDYQIFFDSYKLFDGSEIQSLRMKKDC